VIIAPDIGQAPLHSERCGTVAGTGRNENHVDFA